MGATTSWKEKHEESTRLIEQGKAAHDAGIDSGEKSKEVHDMFAPPASSAPRRRRRSSRRTTSASRSCSRPTRRAARPTSPSPRPPGATGPRWSGSAHPPGRGSRPPQGRRGVLRRRRAADRHERQDRGQADVKGISRQAQNMHPETVKVLNEGTTTTGGFLVVPDFMPRRCSPRSPAGQRAEALRLAERAPDQRPAP